MLTIRDRSLLLAHKQKLLSDYEVIVHQRYIYLTSRRLAMINYIFSLNRDASWGLKLIDYRYNRKRYDK